MDNAGGQGTTRILRVHLDASTGKLWYKLPEKGARWRKGYADMSAISREVQLERPFEIEFVSKEELDL